MIDWEKALECNNGGVSLVCNSESFMQVCSASTAINPVLDPLSGCVTYWVDRRTGRPSNKALDESFAVHNKPTNRDKAIEIIKNIQMTAAQTIDVLIEAGLISED